MNHLQVKEGELARAATILIHEAAGKVAAKDGSQIVLGHLLDCQHHVNEIRWAVRLTR